MTQVTKTLCDGCGNEIPPRYGFVLSFAADRDHDFSDSRWDVCSLQCAQNILGWCVQTPKGLTRVRKDLSND